MRQPSLFIPHGGGPCFFMDWDPPQTWESLRAFLAGIVGALAERPRAILIATAHWEAPEFRFAAAPAPGLIYDYSGFPPHTYELRHDAPGDPDLAARAAGLLTGAGIAAGTDAGHGWDHGVFIPLKVMDPGAEIPVVAMSLKQGLDAAAHWAAGAALAPLRDEGVLIVGSGMSFHNLRALFDPRAAGAGAPFDTWLAGALDGTARQVRKDALTRWASAPGARAAHPRPEHLIPLMVAAGAGADDPGARIYADTVMGQPLSAFRFG